MADPKQRPARRSADDAGLRARGIYLLPNLFTSAALSAGFYAIAQAINSILSCRRLLSRWTLWEA